MKKKSFKDLLARDKKFNSENLKIAKKIGMSVGDVAYLRIKKSGGE